MKNSVTFEKLRTLAENEVEKILKELPEPLRKAADLPVILEALPSAQDISEGLDADLLGLFVGSSLAEASGVEGEAPHVILYLQNLWDEADGELEAFYEEVRITLLHELGHYLDLNEEDLEERGLG